MSAFVFSGVHSSRLGRRRAVPETHQLAIKARKHAPWSAFWFPMPTHSLRPSSPRERAGRYSSRGPRRGMRQGECPSLRKKKRNDRPSLSPAKGAGVLDTSRASVRKCEPNAERCVLTACCAKSAESRSWSCPAVFGLESYLVYQSAYPTVPTGNTYLASSWLRVRDLLWPELQSVRDSEQSV